MGEGQGIEAEDQDLRLPAPPPRDETYLIPLFVRIKARRRAAQCCRGCNPPPSGARPATSRRLSYQLSRLWRSSFMAGNQGDRKLTVLFEVVCRTVFLSPCLKQCQRCTLPTLSLAPSHCLPFGRYRTHRTFADILPMPLQPVALCCIGRRYQQRLLFMIGSPAMDGPLRLQGPRVTCT